MKTPIYDFVQNYIASGTARFHMPGHKGRGKLGLEALDITEVSGADVLYSPNGIIEQSEDLASELFGTSHTFYSTEGSSLAIRAMLAMASEGRRGATVFAARNAHKAFIYAAALLDLSVVWLGGEDFSHVCGCKITPKSLAKALEASSEFPCAVYITSPDYLGNTADIKGLSNVCRAFGVPLLVDNAHGAYLRFLPQDMHPITLGADMCCDSAHKTLPVLTGGAYLHVSKSSPHFVASARKYLSLFASTSPSYLTLQSLDLCNEYLGGDYKARLSFACEWVSELKDKARGRGFFTIGDEPLKITFDAKSAGYMGTELADILRSFGIECEFADPDYVVLMITPENTKEELLLLCSLIDKIEVRTALPKTELALIEPKTKMSPREAVLSPSETVDIFSAIGRVCAEPAVACPPAVPIVHSGEIIEKEHVAIMEYYGYTDIAVVCE